MTTARVLRIIAEGLWAGFKLPFIYLLWWPGWSALTMVTWVASIITGAWFALMVLLCPGPKLKDQLINHSQFWFKK